VAPSGVRVPEYTLRHGNSFALVKNISDASIQLTVTSPPYNIGKIYERRTSLDKYLAEFEGFARDLYRATAASGSVCWQVGNYVERGEVYPLDIFFYRLFKSAGFKLRNRIVWHFEHGLHAKARLSGRYETILWFTKTDKYVFDLDPIRVPAKYPGKRHFKGSRKGSPSANPLGKNPGDFWRDVVAHDWETLAWDIPNVKANHPEKTKHPCQFPVELVQRCVLALTRETDLVLDPFMGTGSTAIGALLHGRRFLGIDNDQRYVQIADERIEQLRNGTIKLRPLGRPVYQPSGRERVAQIPVEWISEEESLEVAAPPV
jgi:DNA modification methylase